MKHKVTKPAVIITGLPWLRTGTGKVMESQVAYFASLGWTVIFLACPHSAHQGSKDPVWDKFRSQSSDLKADHVLIATFKDHVSKGGAIGKAVRRWRKNNGMHWAMVGGSAAVIPSELGDLLGTLDVRLILTNHVYTLPVAKRLRKIFPALRSTRLAVVTHDVQSHILHDNGVLNPFTKRLDAIPELEATEIEALSASDYLIHVSHADCDFFRKHLPNIPQSVVLPTCEDNRSFNYPLPAERFVDYLFVGSNHIGNLDSGVWLLETVLPWFRSEHSLRFVGTVDLLLKDRRPDLYEKHGQIFFGGVKDTKIHYATAHCSLIPMVSGRGVSIKTVEASSFGLPLIGTSLAFRGLKKETVRDAGMEIYDHPWEFAKAAEEALIRPMAFRESSSRLYRALFSEEAFRTAMTYVLDELAIAH